MSVSSKKKPAGTMSLASMCKQVIAKNLERYPAEGFCAIEENQWDAIVKLKYQMTSPTVKSQGSSLSDGRRNPLLHDKCIQEIEGKNPHLNHSQVSDELIWKDCTDFRFKRGGSSRPLVMDMPWNVQVRRMKKIATNLPLLLSEPQEDDDDEQAGGEAGGRHLSIQTNKLQNYTSALISSPMSVPLLSESGIGKAVKKFIKECKKHETRLPPYFPLINTVANNALYPKYAGKSFFIQLEMLLEKWMALVAAKGADACSGRHRNTSKEQHLKDLEIVQHTFQWRDLFDALHEREQITIKSRGANMRKIRDNLVSNRHTIKSTNIKKVGNRKLGDRLLNGDAHLAQSSRTSSSASSAKISKLNMIKQETFSQKARMKGGNAGSMGSAGSNLSGFSASVASSSGQKRSSGGVNLTSKKNQRTFALGNGKQMKIPNLKRKRG